MQGPILIIEVRIKGLIVIVCHHIKCSCYETELGISVFLPCWLLQSRSQSYAYMLYSPQYSQVFLSPQELTQSLWEPLTAYKAAQVNER